MSDNQESTTQTPEQAQEPVQQTQQPAKQAHWTQQQPATQRPEHIVQSQPGKTTQDGRIPGELGWKKIDFNRPLDEQKDVIQNRLNYLYKQVQDGKREHESAWQASRQYLEGLERRNKDLESRISRQETSSVQAEVESIKAQAVELLSSDDPENIKKGADLLVEVSKKEAQASQESTPQQTPQQVTEEQLIKYTVDYLRDPRVANHIGQWAQSRQWTRDPVLQRAAINKLSEDLRNSRGNTNLDVLLAGVEQFMQPYIGAQYQAPGAGGNTEEQFAAQVLGGGQQLTTPQNDEPQPLTASEEKAAVNLFRNLSREEAIAKYQKSKMS